jgi:hypothetical protein
MTRAGAVKVFTVTDDTNTTVTDITEKNTGRTLKEQNDG